MSLTRKWKLALAATIGTTALAGTAYAVDAPTWQQFEASTYTDPTGVRIVNGDEPVDSTGELRRVFDDLTGAHADKTAEADLVVNTVNGVDDKWSATQVGNLTYCVSDKFGADKAAIVTAMTDGAALWEGASSAVDFIHVPAEDASCNTRNNRVLFSVEPVNTSQYIARAFFPSTPKRSRNVLIDDSIFSAGTWTPANVLGHELGHTLGFRHEHTRPEAGTCFENNSWRPLTPYDSVSIMHYPQCNGGSENLSFSSYDAQGVRALYGS
jgi:Dual-action HEIGH metallo-peptidase